MCRSTAELQRLVVSAADPYADRDVLVRQIAREERNAAPWPTSWTAGTRRAEGEVSAWGQPQVVPLTWSGPK
ncbi:hypothetical protein [Streptomyces sp. NPDC053720]|uniref:hypothetical protein n=1 Tax=Streptomyces sp. NPDC053720 TaxID=3154855 RepID=UPI00344923DD